ncbi:hypothetical protein B0H67DRAFT_27758 [Lasiosphaeris hirsuta]|uniref:Uncharacterized protein n=1 Tax=Lasiosphaeris hirsuta TaxID=260670 RepID=A0AA40EAP7_9PEZI|nr:hypothetical protein B0H67DRAFT_27758 [Lasiosphaeris hirsuta]
MTTEPELVIASLHVSPAEKFRVESPTRLRNIGLECTWDMHKLDIRSGCLILPDISPVQTKLKFYPEVSPTVTHGGGATVAQMGGSPKSTEELDGILPHCLFSLGHAIDTRWCLVGGGRQSTDVGNSRISWLRAESDESPAAPSLRAGAGCLSHPVVDGMKRCWNRAGRAKQADGNSTGKCVPFQAYGVVPGRWQLRFGHHRMESADFRPNFGALNIPRGRKEKG